MGRWQRADYVADGMYAGNCVLVAVLSSVVAVRASGGSRAAYVVIAVLWALCAAAQVRAIMLHRGMPDLVQVTPEEMERVLNAAVTTALDDVVEQCAEGAAHAGIHRAFDEEDGSDDYWRGTMDGLRAAGNVVGGLREQVRVTVERSEKGDAD